MFPIPRSLCSSVEFATSHEWLVTNGLGSYAAGTIADVLTRRYHGVLIAALNPPLNRTLLVSKLDVTAMYDDDDYRLVNNQWDETDLDLEGLQYLQQFTLDGGIPVWTYAMADALLEKRIWMEQGAHNTYVTYRLQRGLLPMRLRIDASINYRDHHANSSEETLKLTVKDVAGGFVFSGDGRQAFLRSDRANCVSIGTWMPDYFMAVEEFRGHDAVDAHFRAATFEVTLRPGEMVTFVASLSDDVMIDGAAALARRQAYERSLIAMAGHETAPPEVQHLTLAADQFIVTRQTANDDEGKTIIAGYHWFADWGRDTMISLPGLTLTTNRYDVAGKILRTYAQFVDQGMLPNRFPELNEAPEYNTVDATLWYFQAIALYVARTGDHDLARELYPVLASIIDWHQRGTRYGIQVDPEDSLLFAGTAGKQLTWMDVKINDWVVTPRHGKPVEVNALWLNALRVMVSLGQQIGRDVAAYTAMAKLAETSFSRFWNPTTGYCFDVLDGPSGDEPTLRPNQLIALALPDCPLNAKQQVSILSHCTRRLLTSAGMRSRNPEDKDYIGRYVGDYVQRDSAYHQGTVWGWLIGPFIDAVLNVTQDIDLAESYLRPMLSHVYQHCMGTISEIFEGDVPFLARGAVAQAWSVAEVLRIWERIAETRQSNA